MHTRTKIIQELLEEADIRINGDRPWDIQIHDDRLFERVIGQGSLGLGEAYMDGWWDCARIDEFIHRILQSHITSKLPMSLTTILTAVRFSLSNPQTIYGARKVAEQHYNLGNDFYASMLDPYMQYSCGYFEETDNLAMAQIKKLDLICRKLKLKPGDHVLDIGCGWGGLAKFMAQKYGCRVTGVNISTEQIAFAREFCKGYPVEIVEQDYRKIEGIYDKIVSVGMFEHVGPQNYASYFKTFKRCLKNDGLALLHAIGNQHARGIPDPWIERYIFPNSTLPRSSQIMNVAEKLFVLEDWHNFGAYYDKTLLAWNANFEKSWESYKNVYGERFKRMWNYYLLSCAGSFRARSIQLWQIILSPHGVPGGYISLR